MPVVVRTLLLVLAALLGLAGGVVLTRSGAETVRMPDAASATAEVEWQAVVRRIDALERRLGAAEIRARESTGPAPLAAGAEHEPDADRSGGRTPVPPAMAAPVAAPDPGVRAWRDEIEARLRALESGEVAVRMGQADELIAALRHHDAAAFERLLAAGAAVDQRTTGGERPLEVAAELGDLAAIERLVARGARVDGRREDGGTPLLLALGGGRREAALRLLQLGADPAALDENGESPLTWAAYNGDLGLVQFLLQSGQPVNQRSRIGSTPLTDAIHGGHVDVVRALLAAGADPNTLDQGGDSALAAAEAAGFHEIAALLRAHGARS